VLSQADINLVQRPQKCYNLASHAAEIHQKHRMLFVTVFWALLTLAVAVSDFRI